MKGILKNGLLFSFSKKNSICKRLGESLFYKSWGQRLLQKLGCKVFLQKFGMKGFLQKIGVKSVFLLLQKLG